MFVGHLGAGLAAKAIDRRIGLGILFAAAMLLDVVLWTFVLIGWERAIVPPDFAYHHYLLFDFPFSHSLSGALIWALAAGIFWATFWDKRRLLSTGALIVALTVLSHWALDALVHAPELTLWGDASPRIGLGLWDHQPSALIAELAIAALGLILFVVRTPSAGWRKAMIIFLTLLVAGLTYVGSIATTRPPNSTAPALTSLIVIILVAALAGWADRPRARG
jgi:hypothetical protein